MSIRASTLVEIMVALVLQMVIFALLLTIYTTIIRQDYWKKAVARQSLEILAREIKWKEDYSGGSIRRNDGITVFFQSELYGQGRERIHLKLEAYTEEKKIAAYEEIILASEK